METGKWVSAKIEAMKTAVLNTSLPFEADEPQVNEPSPPAVPTMYLGMDDTGVPLCPSELVDRNGKQPDGTAKTRKLKLVTAWIADARNNQALPVHDRGSATYSAAVKPQSGPAASGPAGIGSWPEPTSPPTTLLQA